MEKTNTEAASIIRERLQNEYLHQALIMERNTNYHLRGNLKIDQFFVLFLVGEAEKKNNGEPQKVYLKELSERLDLPITDISGIVQVLSDRGYVFWTHDDDGSQGTYVTLTKGGRELLAENGQHMRQSISKAIDKFGEEKMSQMLSLMREFSQLIYQEHGN